MGSFVVDFLSLLDFHLRLHYDVMLIRSGLHLTHTAGPSRLVSPNMIPPTALRLSS